MPAFYFDPDPFCRCGRPSRGTLRTSGSESYGRLCAVCGKAEVRRRNAEDKLERYRRSLSRNAPG